MDKEQQNEQQDVERAEQEGMVPQNQEEGDNQDQEEEERARLEAELEQAKSEAEEAESDAAQAEAENVESTPATRPSRTGTRQSEADPEYHFNSDNIIEEHGEWAVTHQGMAHLYHSIFISSDMLHVVSREYVESRYPYTNADEFEVALDAANEYHQDDDEE